eukprot:sb/3470754/
MFQKISSDNQYSLQFYLAGHYLTDHRCLGGECLSTNQNSLFRSCDWSSANQGPVFPDLVGSWFSPHSGFFWDWIGRTCVRKGGINYIHYNMEFIELISDHVPSQSMLSFPRSRVEFEGYLSSEYHTLSAISVLWEVTTNENSLFRSRDWSSANQGPVFPDSGFLTPQNKRGSWEESKRGDTCLSHITNKVGPRFSDH